MIISRKPWMAYPANLHRDFFAGTHAQNHLQGFHNFIIVLRDQSNYSPISKTTYHGSSSKSSVIILVHTISRKALTTLNDKCLLSKCYHALCPFFQEIHKKYSWHIVQVADLLDIRLDVTISERLVN